MNWEPVAEKAMWITCLGVAAWMVLVALSQGSLELFVLWLVGSCAIGMAIWFSILWLAFPRKKEVKK